MFVAMPDGKWKLHTVSAASDRNGKLVLRIKKMSLVMQAFSNARECKKQPCICNVSIGSSCSATPTLQTNTFCANTCRHRP